MFKGKRHTYTFRNLCLEDVDIQLQDGATKLFLSTKGEIDDISSPLKNFLDYVDGHEPADELMEEIDKAAEEAGMSVPDFRKVANEFKEEIYRAADVARRREE